MFEGNLIDYFSPNLEALHVTHCDFSTFFGQEWPFWKHARAKTGCPALKILRVIGNARSRVGSVKDLATLFKRAKFKDEAEADK